MTSFDIFRALCGAALITLFALAAGAVDEAKPTVPLPSDAVSAISVYDNAIKEAEKKLALAKAEAARACDKRLMACIKTATQKGDLDTALVLKAKWTEICGQLPEYASPVVEDAVAAQKVVGTWSYKKPGWDVSITFKANGTFTCTPGNSTGKWRVDGNKVRFTLDANPLWWNTINASDSKGDMTFSGDTWDKGAGIALARKLK